MLSYIPREYMYLDILHVFYTYPKRVQDTFRIHIKYIKIHVSCALPSCHTGYMSGYIRIHVSWTLHHDTSGYTEIQNHDTCGIHAGYMRDTCGIHAGHVSRGFGGMYRCHHGEQRTYQATHVLLVQKWVLSSTLQLLHLLLCHGHPYPCWSTTHVKRDAQDQLLLLHCKVMEARELLRLLCLPRHLPRHLPRQLR